MADAIRLSVDPRTPGDLRSIAQALSNPKSHDKASRAGYRKQLSKIARNLRRETRGQGYPQFAKDIGSQLQAKRKGAGHEYLGRVGIRKRAKRNAALWHLINLGPKPHVLNKSGIRHPGYEGKGMRDKAARPTKNELTTVWWAGYKKTYEREVAKGRR